MRSLVTLIIGIASLTASTGTAVAQSADYQRDAREIYARAIAFPTVAGRGEVPKLVAWLVTRLKAGGVAQSDIAILPHKDTAALIVRVAGSDPAARPILFSAHTDVVEAKPADWSRDPFTLVEEDGKFYGRGAFDNKAGVAAMSSTILRLQRRPRKLRRTLVFAFVGDEESALETTALIVAHPWVKNAERAINTDAGYGQEPAGGGPPLYLVQGAEKTYASFEITARNPGGHSSRPRRDNAIFDLGAVLVRLASFRSPPIGNQLSRTYLSAVGKMTGGELGQALRDFAVDPVEGPSAERLFGEPEYVGVTRTTCVPTLLRAGHAENALPQTAAVTVNCRIFPGEKLEQVRERIVAHIDDPKIEVRSLYPEVESPVSDLSGDVAFAIARSIHKHHPGAIIAPYLESGASDGRIYRSAGIPTFGTSGHFTKPSEAALHGLNENLPVNSFYQVVEHVFDLAETLGGAR